MILKVNNVRKSFGELFVLRNVNFKVKKGEIFGIAGPNGAGKSTLFNIISGSFRGLGEILFNGEDISKMQAHRVCHKGIARTFQIPTVFLTMTVRENVMVGAHFGISGHKADRAIVSDVLKFVGLDGKENVGAARLNLLEKKLTMLAAALATSPQILLLDEPMGGLSPFEIIEFEGLIQKVNKEFGITILIIEHLIKTLLNICNSLMILHYGETILVGPPQEVVNDKQVVEIYLGAESYA